MRSRAKEWFAQLQEAVTVLEERRPETQIRAASRRGRVKSDTIAKHLGDKAQWVTINGVHVLINKETGEPVIGPDSIVRQRAATGQRNVDQVMGGKDHGFKVEDGKGENGGLSMKHQETGVDVPLKGAGLDDVLMGLAAFIDAAATLVATATVVAAKKLEDAIRRADEAISGWTIS